MFILDPTNAFQISEFDYSSISYLYLDFQTHTIFNYIKIGNEFLNENV